jgi:hypothetical protein
MVDFQRQGFQIFLFLIAIDNMRLKVAIEALTGTERNVDIH